MAFSRLRAPVSVGKSISYGELGSRFLTDATGERRKRQFRQNFRGVRSCRPDPSGESGFIRKALLYRGGVVSSFFIIARAFSQSCRTSLARFSLLSGVGALAGLDPNFACPPACLSTRVANGSGCVVHTPRQSRRPCSSTTQIDVVFCDTPSPT